MKSLAAQLGVALLLWILAVPPLAGADDAEKYVVEYPAAERFCPPVVGYFDEVQRTISRVGNRTFRHQPNGGYGLPVVDKVADAHLLHLGADVAWHRVGDPVFAVANGVVRISEGPPKEDKKNKEEKSSGRKQSSQLEWGNLVVIEHRLPDEKYVTTIYGHLANDRLVAVGDVVRAGQQIGTIGAAKVNGGYKPHLHFGVRTGRMAEVGRALLFMPRDGSNVPLKIAEVREDAVVLTSDVELPDQLQLTVNEQTFEMRKQGERIEVSPAILNVVRPPEFALVGYGLSTEGWHDPTTFLREQGAETAPAPFEVVERRRAPRKNRRSEVESKGNGTADIPAR